MGQNDEAADEAASGSYSGDEAVQFEEVARLFEGARDLQGDARRVFLERETGQAGPLRREVERLLDLHEADSGVLDERNSSLNPTVAMSALDARDPETSGLAPETIGRYRVERRLGRGGMGQVFLATHEERDFQKRVAIKVLRPGMDDADLLRRFRSERRILAQLEHRSIASLVDGGALEDGRPYVVMEYVEGKDVIRFTRERNLSLEERLRLFVKICDAVEHAHRNLVVHRDLKPTNILVTADGEPKLLDFGIAKLLDTENDGHSVVHTSTGMSLFTPEYASPEQVRGEPITTATDVYSLGALLYEMLTDVRAHRLETRRPAEVEQVVCDIDPAPPSTATESPMSPRWRKHLAGDLDNITLMALRKETRRRYGSVGELSEDIERFLGGLPVRARKDTVGYRASKFVRRNAWGVGLAALLLALLSTFAVVMAVQAGRIARQRDIAEREGEIASEVSEFLVQLFETSDPYRSAGEEVLARTLLDEGAQRISRELRSGPLVRAELMDTMGQAYTALGLYDEARPLAQASLELREAHDTPARAAEARGLLGMLERGRGDYDAGERLMRESLDELERLGERSFTQSRIQIELAMLLSELGRSAEALELTERSYATRVELLDPPHRRLASALTARANVHQDLGQFDVAEPLFLEALAMHEAASGPDHPETAMVHNDIADFYKMMGRLEESLEHLETALRIDMASLGPDHPQVNNDYFGLAQVVEDMGDLTRAEQLYREILERDRARFGEKHPYVALDLSSIAGALSDQGRYEEAIALFEEALLMQRETLPEDAPEIATTLSNMGVLYRRWRRPEEARAYLEDALAMREQIFPPDHPTVLTARSIIGSVLVDQGRIADAEEIFRDVLELRREKLGLHSQVGGSLFSVAMCRQRLGDLEGAAELFGESVAVYEATVHEDHPDLARPLIELGNVLVRLGRPAEAIGLLERGLAIRATSLPDDHLEVADARLHLANGLARLPEPGDFEPLFEAALAVYTARLGEGHGLTRKAASDLATARELAARVRARQEAPRGD